ncbi:MAG: hypothetical protein LKCHEGNO_03243 [Burkholderiaceae bacterium]|nr:hypothetical protein [Burkholderiaceae bacterium]
MPIARSASHTRKTASRKGGFHPLRWMRRLLSRPLKLKRIGRQWHVVFDDSRQHSPTSKPASRGEALRLSHLALQALLHEHRDVRHVLPHLIHLEQALSRAGSRALIELPLKVLQRAMDQLDTIQGGQQAQALLPLRLRVEESVRQRTPVNLRGDIANVDVRETSVSQYDEAEVELTNRMALDEASNRMALDEASDHMALDEIYAKAGVGVPATAGK